MTKDEQIRNQQKTIERMRGDMRRQGARLSSALKQVQDLRRMHAADQAEIKRLKQQRADVADVFGGRN